MNKPPISPSSAIQLSHLNKVYGTQKVLCDLNIHIQSGEFVGIIGPNGSGKTTLLHLISGAVTPSEGEVHIMEQPLSSYSRKALSQQLAVLQQDGIPAISFPVHEVIRMGRYPFLDWLGRDRYAEVEELITLIMDRLELHALAERPVSELSGGQRQRVALGKVMAQQPAVLLLDEPTTYLDIRYQIQFMELVSRWQQEEGLTVIAVMHDLNLASLFCSRLLVLHEQNIVADGSPHDILTEEMVERVFGVQASATPHPDSGVPQILLKRKEEGK
ncbi:iron complex transport system ATP-binding protein [Paenibacillus shirakamiensis]|uniref:Iron complex transport system ATP-binding protein n=1 Tax=Paenibacillus shirakamiensis TaxID=1265935 RepID=A0ABS4JFN8_9BACL|nr:ABC transporter ATP-binding protein [Paenibacillus shirakamiensis]MBP2000529.1 iron complex transport system ATP-binding protein [Paenibacillus shirakamiensis]